MLSIIIIDDHPLFSEGLSLILNKEEDFTVAARYENGEQAIKQCQTLKVDIAIVDLEMPNLNGVETVKQLRQIHPQVRSIILTMSEEADKLKECLHAGAYGYLLKNTELSFLIQAIRQASKGNTTLSQEMTNKLYEMSQTSLLPHSFEEAELSERELDVLAYIAQGVSNKAIAYEMGLSTNTVKTHTQNILRKLHLTNRVQASIYANQHNIRQYRPIRRKS